jgi:hypothetical protein
VYVRGWGKALWSNLARGVGSIRFLPLRIYTVHITMVLKYYMCDSPMAIQAMAMKRVRKYPRIGSVPERPPPLAKKWISGKTLSWQTLYK